MARRPLCPKNRVTLISNMQSLIWRCCLVHNLDISALPAYLGVTRAAVYYWISGERYPASAMLARLEDMKRIGEAMCNRRGQQASKYRMEEK